MKYCQLRFSAHVIPEHFPLLGSERNFTLQNLQSVKIEFHNKNNNKNNSKIKLKTSKKFVAIIIVKTNHPHRHTDDVCSNRRYNNSA